jgi:hypothetical protein
MFESHEAKRAYQKKIFQEYYITIMYYLRNKVDVATFTRLNGMHDVKYMNDLRKQGIDFQVDDFRQHDTEPANISIAEDPDADMNPEKIDRYDQNRINALFESFIYANPTQPLSHRTIETVRSKT